MEQANEATGETKDVVVARTVPSTVKHVWDVLMTTEGAEALLGPGATLGNKGDAWRSHDGREGVVRTFHPLEEIRFSWRLNHDAPATMVSVTLHNAGASDTEVKIKHSKLPSAAVHDRVKARWTAALERIESECL